MKLSQLYIQIQDFIDVLYDFNKKISLNYTFVLLLKRLFKMEFSFYKKKVQNYEGEAIILFQLTWLVIDNRQSENNINNIIST